MSNGILPGNEPYRSHWLPKAGAASLAALAIAFALTGPVGIVESIVCIAIGALLLHRAWNL